MVTALPKNPFNAVAAFAAHFAYSRCLRLETHGGHLTHPDRLSVLVCARLLGFFLIHAPTNTGRTNLASEIIHCTSKEDVLDLAETYNMSLIRCFRSKKGRTPALCSHPSASSPKETDNQVSEDAPTSHDRAKQSALERDRYRCMLTGEVDDGSVLAEIVPDPYPLGITQTHLAHIVNRSTKEDLDVDSKKDYAASVDALLNRFGGILNPDELNGTNVHRLENVMTLSADVHAWFGDLKIWLEKDPNDPEHCYRPRGIRGYYTRQMPDSVQFTTQDPVHYPLPDPRYLAIHAACAKAAHLSGATEYMDKVYRVLEATDALATSGGSLDLLYYALLRRPDIVVQ